jgi:hypothetical protein
MIEPSELEPAGWVSYPTDTDEDICCTGYFSRETDKCRMTLKFHRDFFPEAGEWPVLLDLDFTLQFKDHWLHSSLQVPRDWSLAQVEEYVLRAYWLLNAVPLTRPE